MCHVIAVERGLYSGWKGDVGGGTHAVANVYVLVTQRLQLLDSRGCSKGLTAGTGPQIELGSSAIGSAMNRWIPLYRGPLSRVFYKVDCTCGQTVNQRSHKELEG